MNISELEEILKKINCTRNTFDGMYPSDLLPLEVKQYPRSFVGNVDISEKPGSHWDLIEISLGSHWDLIGWHVILLMISGEFFDSYGLLIDTQNISKIS